MAKKAKIQERKELIEEFINSVLGSYSVIETEIEVNDDSDDEYTAFEVKISNKENEKAVHVVLQQGDDSQDIQLLMGEDFYDTDSEHFLEYLFVQTFCY